jgi:cell division protein FtsB
VLAVLVLVAAVAVAPYLRSLAAQQAELAALRADVAERRAAVEDLQAELDRWDDPAFVRARARERLFMVMPGEVGYVVLDPPSQEESAPDDAASVAQAASAGEDRPWFGDLWESVRLAAAEPPAAQPQPTTPAQPVPAPEITDPGPGAPTQGSP